MIKLTIEGREYRAPADWSEITLRKFIAISSIEVPKRLASLYEASAALNDPDPQKKERNEARYESAVGALTEWDLVRRFPVYYGRVMSALADIPESFVRRIHHEPRTAFFDQYARYIILSTFYSVPVTIDPDEGVKPYEAPPIESFELSGQKFFLPKSLRVVGEDIPLGRETAITFAEAADLDVALSRMRNGAAKNIPLFCAVYCRPEGEVYDEEGLLKRAELFEDLTMDTAWTVFFCIAALYEKYKISTRGYLTGVARLLQESLTEANLGISVGADKSTT